MDSRGKGSFLTLCEERALLPLQGSVHCCYSHKKTLAYVYEVLIFCTRYQAKDFIEMMTLTPENISRQLLLCPF